MLRTADIARPQRGTVSWWLRGRLSQNGRRAARRIADRTLRPLGSVCGVDLGSPAIALTFDDGPDPLWTPAVLDVLKRRSTHATFFVLVDRVRHHPALIRRIAEEGHELALHGPDHTRTTHHSYRMLLDRLRSARTELEALSGQPIRWYRPPFGAQRIRAYAAARRAGLDVVVWSHHCEDWMPHPVTWFGTEAVRGMTPGGVLLLHDGLVPDPDDPTPPVTFDRGAMTDAVLDALGEAGFRLMPVGALLALGSARRTAWFRP